MAEARIHSSKSTSKIENAAGTVINPATNEKLDEVIAALGGTTNENILIDETTTANITYIGYASIGSNEANNVWKIKIVDESTSVTKIKWAAGNDNYDNIWSNRATLSYS